MLFVEDINVQLRTNNLYKDLSQIQEMFNTPNIIYIGKGH